MTVSIENFVKAIYKQGLLPVADTRLGKIAALLNITNAAATDMAKKLANKGLVNYTRYKPLTLTPEGHNLAVNVIRKHRLWETFLHKTLQLSLHEIHREAEQLEHFTSDFLAEKISQYLGNPMIDPHGDPIPDFKGIVETDKAQMILSQAIDGYNYKISRLNSSDKDFFDFCTANHIAIGSTIWVEKQYNANKMTEIKINQNKLILNDIFTKVIYVKQVN